MDIKLSSIQEKISQAQSPLPLFTCLHVKPDVSELMFAGKCRVEVITDKIYHSTVHRASHIAKNQCLAGELDHMEILKGSAYLPFVVCRCNWDDSMASRLSSNMLIT